MSSAKGSADWVIREILDEASTDAIDVLARDLMLPSVVARLLWLRGVRTPSRARRFLSPRLADLSPPEGLPGMDQAAERLARAVRSCERVAVCGDYDVDGMTGTALLVRFFQIAGGDVVWSIPRREEDGYGLSVAAVERLAKQGVRVAVTDDNGISAIAPIARARELGMDVLVTDHHLPGDVLPDATAIVNPHLATGPSDVVAPCGCTLAFKLAWAVADKLRGLMGGKAEERFRAFLRDAVGLAALATVSDVVPLQGENRVLVAAGLAALRRSVQPGVRALLAVAKVGRSPLTTEDVGFKIGPRLNAAGRLSKPELVIELLTTDDEARARVLADELDEANNQRREIEVEVRDLALAEAEALLERGPRSSLVVWGDDWHQGVIGIVAARLVDRFGLPSVVIGLAGREGRGSGRTPFGVNLHEAFTSCAPHLSRFGGHAAAAGLEIERDRLGAFRDAMENAVREQLCGNSMRPVIEIDAISDVDEWSVPAVQSVYRLAPFGQSNPEPVFMVKGASVAGEPRLMGSTSAHLSFALKQNGGAIRVVAFRRADLYELAASGAPVDLAVTPVVNEWKGYREAELRLLDMRAHDPDA